MSRPIPERILVYKRTHEGDPDKNSQCFGVWDCMGERVRDQEFDAVIGIGGIGPKVPDHLKRTLHWIGITPKKSRGRCRQGYRTTLVKFEKFRYLASDQIDIRREAPRLAKLIYDGRIRHIVVDKRFPKELKAAQRLLRRANSTTRVFKPKAVRPCGGTVKRRGQCE